MKFQREKGRNILLSFFYKFDKILPFSKTRKLKLYLDLEWIFERLAHEQSFKAFGKTSHPGRKLSATFLLEHLQESQEVLDVGCNSGELTFLISKKAKRVTGIDYDSNLIQEARERYGNPGIEFIKGDAMTFLTKNNVKFDVIILSHIAEHLDDPGALLNLCKRHCTYIYIEMPDLDRTHLNIYRRVVKSSLMYSDADHIWELDRAGLQKLLHDHGWIIDDSEFIFGVQKYWCKQNVPQDYYGSLSQ